MTTINWKQVSVEYRTPYIKWEHIQDPNLFLILKKRLLDIFKRDQIKKWIKQSCKIVAISRNKKYY